MKKNRAATEEKIYNAFLSVLKEKGPQGAGINAIAKEAGVSKGLIYRYFDGIKGLLLRYAKSGDFFKSLLTIDDTKSGVENLKNFTKEGTKELRENLLAQEILRWQLIENNENTKDLFKYTNRRMGKAFAIDNRESSLNDAMQLMIGGYVYFALLSKFNKTFVTTDLTSDQTWDKFDKAIEKTIELFEES